MEPRATTSRWATGAALHSQPGRIAPASPAIGTAYTARRGTVRAMNAPGTNAAIAALIPTPSTRNGNACSIVAMNTVPQLWSSG